MLMTPGGEGAKFARVIKSRGNIICHFLLFCFEIVSLPLRNHSFILFFFLLSIEMENTRCNPSFESSESAITFHAQADGMTFARQLSFALRASPLDTREISQKPD